MQCVRHVGKMKLVDLEELSCWINYIWVVLKDNASEIWPEKTNAPADESIIPVGAERFRYAEALSRAGFNVNVASGFHDTSFRCLMKCDVDNRKNLYANVVLSGGTTIHQGLASTWRMNWPRKPTCSQTKTSSPSALNVSVAWKRCSSQSHWPAASTTRLSRIIMKCDVDIRKGSYAMSWCQAVRPVPKGFFWTWWSNWRRCVAPIWYGLDLPSQMSFFFLFFTVAQWACHCSPPVSFRSLSKKKIIRIFDLSRHGQTVTWLGKISRGNRGLVMWHGSVCEEIRGKTLGIGKQERITFFKVSTPRLNDHRFKEDELVIVGELPTVCSQLGLRCLYEARIGAPDNL